MTRPDNHWENNRAAQLYREYERKLRELQDSCPHIEVSEWMQEEWAPGHGTDRQVQLCNECNKVLHVKLWCRGCFKELVDDEAKEGDGRERPMSSFWCEECMAKPYVPHLTPDRGRLARADTEQRRYPGPKQRELSDEEKQRLRERIGRGEADIYQLAHEFGCSPSQIAGIKAAMNR